MDKKIKNAVAFSRKFSLLQNEDLVTMIEAENMLFLKESVL